MSHRRATFSFHCLALVACALTTAAARADDPTSGSAPPAPAPVPPGREAPYDPALPPTLLSARNTAAGTGALHLTLDGGIQRLVAWGLFYSRGLTPRLELTGGVQGVWEIIGRDADFGLGFAVTARLKVGLVQAGPHALSAISGVIIRSFPDTGGHFDEYQVFGEIPLGLSYSYSSGIGAFHTGLGADSFVRRFSDGLLGYSVAPRVQVGFSAWRFQLVAVGQFELRLPPHLAGAYNAYAALAFVFL